jgi:DNA-binding NtrC family response regulator
MAEGGTLLLDEIDSLSPGSQSKLLRFLQERAYKPLGADRFLRADVNVLAACNQDLDACVQQQRFRRDLFFRLNVLRLHLLPLRQRRGDIERLANHYLRSFSQKSHDPRRTFSAAALRRLVSHDWPGNVRELVNVVQRALALSEGSVILPVHVAISRDEPEAQVDLPDGFCLARRNAIATFERTYVADLFLRHGGNVTHAAREAKKDRRAFGRLVKKYGLARERT